MSRCVDGWVSERAIEWVGVCISECVSMCVV